MKLHKESRAWSCVHVIVLCVPSLELDPVATMLLMLKGFVSVIVVMFGDFFIQFSNNLAMFSVLDAYKDVWFGVVVGLCEEVEGNLVSGKIWVGLSRDRASHKACLAMWISV